MNGCMKFLLSHKHNTVLIKKQKEASTKQNVFLLKYYEICLKYAKYRNQLEIYQGKTSLKINYKFNIINYKNC